MFSYTATDSFDAERKKKMQKNIVFYVKSP